MSLCHEFIKSMLGNWYGVGVHGGTTSRNTFSTTMKISPAPTRNNRRSNQQQQQSSSNQLNSVLVKAHTAHPDDLVRMRHAGFMKCSPDEADNNNNNNNNNNKSSSKASRSAKIHWELQFQDGHVEVLDGVVRDDMRFGVLMQDDKGEIVQDEVYDSPITTGRHHHSSYARSLHGGAANAAAEVDRKRRENTNLAAAGSSVAYLDPAASSDRVLTAIFDSVDTGCEMLLRTRHVLQMNAVRSGREQYHLEVDRQRDDRRRDSGGGSAATTTSGARDVNWQTWAAKTHAPQMNLFNTIRLQGVDQ